MNFILNVYNAYYMPTSKSTVNVFYETGLKRSILLIDNIFYNKYFKTTYIPILTAHSTGGVFIYVKSLFYFFFKHICFSI